MNMENNTPHRRKPKFLLFCALALALSLFSAGPAKAQLCDGCVVAAIGTETAVVTPYLTAMNVELAGLPVYLADFLVALYGPPTGPGLGIDLDVVDGFGQVNGAINLLATQALPMMSQVVVDSMKQYMDGQGQADLAPDALLSELSTHCAVTYGLQSRNAMEAFITAMTRAAMQVVRNRDSGPQSGNPSISQVVCEHAPFIANSTRYSNNMAAAIAGCKNSDAALSGTTPPAYLVDGDTDIGNVFGKLQLAMPDNMSLTPNNHVQFKPGNDGEWEYVAAWRFCESYIPPNIAPPNTNSQSLTVEDIRRAFMTARLTALKLPAVQACMNAISYRTACSQGPAADFVLSAIGNCWQIQDVACNRLTNSPPGGLGITSTGNADADYALANCKTDGLSGAMFDYIYAHRCSDINYMTAVVPDQKGDVSKVAEERSACAKDKTLFEDRLKKEKSEFLEAVQLLNHNG